LKKYVVFGIGLLLFVSGYLALYQYGRSMANSETGYSSTEYALLICFAGVLPLVIGTIMCFFSTKKGLRERRLKMDMLKAEDAEAAAAAEAKFRKMRRDVILGAICFVVPETVILLKVFTWMGIHWLEEWPRTLLFFSLILFSNLLGTYWGIILGRRAGAIIVDQIRAGKR
jgi:hypothetical protein